MESCPQISWLKESSLRHKHSPETSLHLKKASIHFVYFVEKHRDWAEILFCSVCR